MPRDAWSAGSLARYREFADDARFFHHAEQLEQEAMQAAGGHAAGAFVYLRKNAATIMRRHSGFDPGVLAYFKALEFIQEWLYSAAVSAAVDPDELRDQYSAFKALALREGGGSIEGAFEWLSANMQQLMEDNFRHSDWALRNRALGFVHKYMSFEKNFGPQAPENWAAMAAARERAP